MNANKQKMMSMEIDYIIEIIEQLTGNQEIDSAFVERALKAAGVSEKSSGSSE